MKHLLLLAFLLLSNALPSYSRLQSGDTVSVNGTKFKLLSENRIANPGFEEGFTGWTDATPSAAALSSAYFTLLQTGGVDNSCYLVGTKNESSTSAGSIGTGWEIEAGKTYYFSYQVKYQSTAEVAGKEEWLKVSLTNDKTASAEPLLLLNAGQVNGSGAWTRNEVVFTNSDPAYSYVMARFRWLNNRLGLDDFMLYEVSEVANIESLREVISEAQSVYDSLDAGAARLQAAIETAQGFLTSESAAEVTQAIADLKAAITTYTYHSASPENPLDLTHFIVNQGFDENRATGWKGAGTVAYHEVEFYQKTFDMYQSISGLPAGKYRMKAQGFERPKGNDGGVAYRAGTETIYARFYAKSTSFPEKDKPFNSLYAHPYSGSDGLNGYVHNMSGAETLLTNTRVPYYEVTLPDILLDEGDVLTIGAKSDFQQNGYWALFDNFRLEYLGAYETPDLEAAIAQQIVEAQGLLDEKIQNSVIGELNAALAQAQQALAADPLAFEDLYAANKAINTAIKNAWTSRTAYLDLQAILEEALEVYSYLTGSKAETLLKAITAAQNVVGDWDATSEAISEATSDLRTLVTKKIHVPTWMMGDVNDPANNWSLERSKQSRNWIVFWEPGYGEDPTTHSDGQYRVDVNGLLDLAERCFDFYADSLKFIKRGSSKTDDYKMIIRLRYTREWEATGSGVDDRIGLLTLTAWSAQAGGHTLAHEVGHCFQYQVHCDNNNQNGWMYGYGENASGGNGWWEQCAQWQGFKIYPEQQFTDGRFANYLNTAHKHILHEAPRYDNYFIQDYWTYRHGMDLIGRLWNESKRPEDPVETYKRITGITQKQFNDEMYDCAARFVTWDIPALRSYGAAKINSRAQTAMKSAEEDYWLVDASVCPENYGYNVIKLNVPARATTVSAFFEGKAGLSGYRKLSILSAGWRYGFVALLNDGTRVYSDMGSAVYRSPKDTVHFECPDNCKQLWLVVTGAPNTHWRHAWDDNDSNDEQWPYQVRFNNTNLLGRPNPAPVGLLEVTEVAAEIYASGNRLYVHSLPVHSTLAVYDITGRCLWNEPVGASSFSTVLPSGIYIVTVHSKDGKYTRKVVVE